MTNSLHNQAAEEADTGESALRLRSIPGRVIQPLRFVSFWIAIALPFLHIPLLLTGLSTLEQTGAFVGLVTANFIAVLFGHSYQPRRQTQ